MPPKLDDDVKAICNHYEFPSFWKRFNRWAYNRVWPVENEMFEFWWSLCKATALLVSDPEEELGNMIMQPASSQLDFVVACLDRKGFEYTVGKFPHQLQNLYQDYLYPTCENENGTFARIQLGKQRYLLSAVRKPAKVCCRAGGSIR